MGIPAELAPDTLRELKERMQTHPLKAKDEILLEFNAHGLIKLISEEVSNIVKTVFAKTISSEGGFEQEDGTFCLFKSTYNNIKGIINSETDFTSPASKVVEKVISKIETL